MSKGSAAVKGGLESGPAYDSKVDAQTVDEVHGLELVDEERRSCKDCCISAFCCCTSQTCTMAAFVTACSTTM